MSASEARRVSGSFRDPAGFMFERDGVLYRQVNRPYERDYAKLTGSGLYDALVKERLLVPHVEEREVRSTPEGIAVLRPTRVPFVSYPYEWCFGQLKDAAVATLRAQRLALQHGMVLKDASAYNAQVLDGRMVLIDTLSFETHREGEPWVAYRQFCQHFLAPLALTAKGHHGMTQLLRAHLDGVPLDLAASALPWPARWRPGLALHLVLHARMQRHAANGANGRNGDRAAARMSPNAMLGLVDSLERLVKGLEWRPGASTWSDYDRTHSYSPEGVQAKERLVGEMLGEALPRTVWDFGANDGRFTRLATERGTHGVAFDGDPLVVERNWRDVKARHETRHLPLVMDLTNPSPALGWAHGERMSLLDRGPADVVMALALVHHLAIANNVPLDGVASFLARAGRQAIVEWVPLDDPQAQRLHAARRGISHAYTRDGFEAAFARHFRIARVEPVEGTGRVLYRMEAAA